MLSINTNLSSLIAQNSMSSATKLLNQAVERMTTGYKINHSKDNAANYSISTNLTTKINAYMVAEDNCAMGLDMLSTANGSLDQISDKLTRLRDLQTQASNGTYGATSLNAINAEANALVDEISRLYQTAEYNGKKLFSSSDAAATPAVAAYGARAAGTNTTYTDEEVAAMISISDVDTFTSGECYSISTAEDLARLAELTNSGVNTYGATFVLANDIDLKEWCEAHAADGGWTPIGGELTYNSYDDTYYISSYFSGDFNGNGHVISNLTINRQTEGPVAFFGAILQGSVENLGVEDVNITGDSTCGGLVGYLNSDSDPAVITNCYVTGNIVGVDHVGGLVGSTSGETKIEITNCYSDVTVNGDTYVGGLIGTIDTNCASVIINNCYSKGTVNSKNGGGFAGGLSNNSGTITINDCYSTSNVISQYNAGGFVYDVYNDNAANTIVLNNCYATGKTIGNNTFGFVVSGNDAVYNNVGSLQSDAFATQMTAEEIAQTYTPESMGFTEANGWKIVNGQPVASFSMAARNANSGNLNGSNYITLQIGINSGESSGIGFDISFALGAIDDLRMIGLDTTTDYLTTLDNMLSTVNAKQTEFGAVENRLNSALDEISIQYENLVSSRSTIRDADIAEVSSEYIRQQILQQASATLLSTANQSPSIALQLI